MKKISEFLQRYHKPIVFLFFAAYFMLGVCLVRSYGIPWDEEASVTNGTVCLKYLFGGDTTMLSFQGRHYGLWFDTLLAVLAPCFSVAGDPRTLYFVRHFIIFCLFFTSIVFFYKICRYQFRDWKFALLGTLFLILSPRIFADSFYNSKDIVFLSLFIISIYTLLRYLDNPVSWGRACLHALACALLIDIRIPGCVLPLVTMFFLAGDAAVGKHKKSHRRVFLCAVAYSILLVCLVVLFWPFLWKNPLGNFMESFSGMSRYAWLYEVLYFGEYVIATRLPWHYIPVWMAITIPLAYSICFFLGSAAILLGFLSHPVVWLRERRNEIIFMALFFIPLAAVIILRSVLYDGWRQMFFIYAPFLLIALAGVRALWSGVKKNLPAESAEVVLISCAIAIAVNLVSVGVFMGQYHPHQNVYFNELAGPTMRGVRARFEMDYWGLSYRQALEHILRYDPGPVVKVYSEKVCAKQNSFILSSEERGRFAFVKTPDEAKYFIGNYRDHKGDYPYRDEIFSISVKGEKIIVVYRL